MTASHDFLPFVRPDIDAAAIAEVGKVLASGWITSGPKMQAFEAALSALFDGRPVRTFANGSATMEIALRIADIGPGDEVITTPITWVATANVVLGVGARPVFVDIDPRTRNLDLDAVEAAITPRTRAIMPVYLSGLPVDMDRLYAMAKKHGLRVIEDAAQAIDSRWRGRRIGAFGDLVSFSFQANKNITTIEGGCLVMNSPEEALRAERLRLQGVIRTGMDGMDVEEPGGKFNLTDVNAVIGLQQLGKLDAITARRAMLAEAYFEGFRATAGFDALGVELPLPLDREAATTNWHMFQVVLPTERMAGGSAAARRQFMEAMRERGIGIGVHYPPVHLFTHYRSLGWREGMLPHAERIGQGIVTLPLFPAMQPADVARVCEIFTDTCKRLSH
ncbi:DegT/DnrJ/EryC1/StrS family aminotransferase [Cupriavidus plantarum]|uniref:dTDP-4-amino-4,6-dideoxygalactose transaminase n=1 Tax=Cupriavidus plantarum TaxID=942865 RepID=A0A316EW84_9BURK|nr:DegT/DnrJ/EryC1/StrS aminotransferase family protein [Cupriavidus plantarum]NYI00781.1 dTDP-4-amino-4,6-dideoxygalactose transaminase [Cupriavidus plantarum]PWK35193.1 dTDP-4-amino-4,6-dideoxygalactose transaminase [Cupriavidus plantarum]REE93638.1 dTDP-4-amino-4,6-dideoxygalactose transaminase [Cupriavidus plantarum]RLK39059.1 dTDP-4-amino-4,6-dideoxygalactose transaminase [Cupriavidus plantarum]CAG2135624.1 UDP-4-amino-4-deoxy-L-arabinose--oxoglutarate aminotransferase [Cupriavidus planta